MTKMEKTHSPPLPDADAGPDPGDTGRLWNFSIGSGGACVSFTHTCPNIDDDDCILIGCCYVFVYGLCFSIVSLLKVH